MEAVAEAHTEARPEWDKGGIPWCAEDACPKFDGKRCALIGASPDRICEPMVGVMATMLDDAEFKP